MTAGDNELERRGPALAAQRFGGGRRAPERPSDPWQPVVVPARDGGEPESEFSLLHYWQVLSRWRWLIAGSVAVALILGVVATLLMTPLYRATATLEIDREAPKVVDNGAVQPTQVFDNEQFYQTQYGLLKSQSLAQRVVTSLNLADDKAFMQGGSGPAKDRPAREQKATAKLLKGLTINPVRTSQLVQVSYQSQNPVEAAKIANAVSDNFIASNLERRYQASAYARQFLEGRINEIRQKLEDSERALVAYATAHQIINLSDGVSPPAVAGQTPAPPTPQSLPGADLAAMDTALDQAKNQRIQAEQHWREAQATSGLGLPEILQSPTIQALQQSKASLQADYQDKLAIYKPDFPAMIEIRGKIAEIDRQIAANVQAIKQSVAAQYQVAQRQEGMLAGQVNKLKGDVLDLRNRSIQYNIIQREVDTDRTLYDGLLQRYKEVGVAGAVGANNISVVDRAMVPTAPFQPRPVLNLAVAGLIGLLAGVLLAFGIEQLDQSVKSPEDIETKLGLPLLGAVPMMGREAPAAALANPRSALTEAYHSLRTALQFSMADGAPRSLLVTSAGPGEGKSTTAAALAQAFSRLGLGVLLIDADLRNPSLHRLFTGDQSKGLSNLLVGNCEFGQAVHPSGQPNLSIITSGPLPPNPAELLAARRMAQILAEAARQFDLVILDGPPIMGLADAPLLANAVDATALVIEAGSMRQAVIKATIARLRGSRARLLGAVLTKFDARKTASSYGYGAGASYAYSYEYGGGHKPPKPRLAPAGPDRWFQRK
ncbi:MAG TPA: polysaccharide biosynthesis tyrosine autokinase [Caulobacteraceae bacterium]|jgi:capsular exopolysaccharide synthesis family protein|nr:polysaccharide biosynthesis tyrosine autokinase [Caulobacteraceae bacterium]